MKNEIIIFDDQNVKLEVNVKDETVWLTQSQMAKLFGKDRTVITRHINNILKSKELHREEVCAKIAHTTKHGAIYGKTQTRQLDYYNLDMIISVGYRINSKQGIIFRKWATKILKDYIIKGYAINQKRLKDLEKTVKLIDIASRIEKDVETNEIIKVINNYSKALNLLEEYDHKELNKPKGNINVNKITYKECTNIIKNLKCSTNSKLFALEKDNGLKAIISDIYQTYDGKDLYLTIEEKAANFLYLIIKNHVFVDGNKRVAAALFIYFLNFYNLLNIDNNTLVAVTILIAGSDPKEKEILIDLVMNFLNKGGNYD